jgi:hypothetical protein
VKPCYLVIFRPARGGSPAVHPVQVLRRGWTREASGFSVPVQPVQAVQPKLEKERTGFSVPAEFF